MLNQPVSHAVHTLIHCIAVLYVLWLVKPCTPVGTSNLRLLLKVLIYFHIRYINYHGNLLPRMIITAQNSGKITVGEACKIMNIKSQYYDDIARAVMK